MNNKSMPTADDNSLLFAMIDDCAAASKNKNCPAFLGFLSDIECDAVSEYTNSSAFFAKFGKDTKLCFFGGYDGAERQIFCALPDWASGADDVAFPVTAVKFSHRAEYPLSHRDYLGAVLALGLERDRVGDIIVYADGAVMLLHSSIADFVVSQITKIGRVGVNCGITELQNIEYTPEYEEIRATVASERIDCVVAALAKCSRERANELILGKFVLLNGKTALDRSHRVASGDTLTVRKKGKFIIDSVSDRTKKGRTVLIARKRK